MRNDERLKSSTVLFRISFARINGVAGTWGNWRKNGVTHTCRDTNVVSSTASWLDARTRRPVAAINAFGVTDDRYRVGSNYLIKWKIKQAIFTSNVSTLADVTTDKFCRFNLTNWLINALIDVDFFLMKFCNWICETVLCFFFMMMRGWNKNCWLLNIIEEKFLLLSRSRMG